MYCTTIILGIELVSQLIPIPDFIKSLPERKKTSLAESELVFLASKLPPFGSKSYYVRKTSSKGRISHNFKSSRADSTISSDVILEIILKIIRIGK